MASSRPYSETAIATSSGTEKRRRESGSGSAGGWRRSAPPGAGVLSTSATVAGGVADRSAVTVGAHAAAAMRAAATTHASPARGPAAGFPSKTRATIGARSSANRSVRADELRDDLQIGDEGLVLRAAAHLIGRAQDRGRVDRRDAVRCQRGRYGLPPLLRHAKRVAEQRLRGRPAARHLKCFTVFVT